MTLKKIDYSKTFTSAPIKSAPGLGAVIDEDTKRIYCATCGVEILNKTWWKMIHLNYHQFNK